MRFDEALKDILGEYGAFSKWIVALVCYEEVFFAFQVYILHYYLQYVVCYNTGSICVHVLNMWCDPISMILKWVTHILL